MADLRDRNKGNWVVLLVVGSRKQQLYQFLKTKTLPSEACASWGLIKFGDYNQKAEKHVSLKKNKWLANSSLLRPI